MVGAAAAASASAGAGAGAGAGASAASLSAANRSVSLNPMLKKNGLLSLEEGNPVTIPINGLGKSITVNTFNFKKRNIDDTKDEKFNGYIRASDLINKLDQIRMDIQLENNKKSKRATDTHCAVGLVHCRSLPGQKGPVSSGCIIPVLDEKPHQEEKEQFLLVRGHGKFMYEPISSDNIQFKNVHYRVKPGNRARMLEKFGDLTPLYGNWIRCAIEDPHYANIKTDDLIQVKYIDLLDMDEVCLPNRHSEGSFSEHTRHSLIERASGRGLRRAESTVIPYWLKPRLNTITEHKGGSIRKTVKKRRRKQTRKTKNRSRTKTRILKRKR